MRALVAPCLALLMTLPASAGAHEEREEEAATPGPSELPQELAPRLATPEPERSEALAQAPTRALLDGVDAGPVEETRDASESSEGEGTPARDQSRDTDDEPIAAPAADPESDDLGPRMTRVGLGMAAVGSALAITSAGLAGGARSTRNKLGTRAYDGIVNGTEHDEPAVEDPAELRRRDELLLLAPRLRQAAAVTGIPAAVFISTGLIMLAFRSTAPRKAPRRISLRATMGPRGGGASLIAGF